MPSHRAIDRNDAESPLLAFGLNLTFGWRSSAIFSPPIGNRPEMAALGAQLTLDAHSNSIPLPCFSIRIPRSIEKAPCSLAP